MTNGRESLAQAVTGKPSVHDCSLEELRALTHRHPYYAPAQFLLFRKLKSTSDPDASHQQGKAILYYPEPLLFKYFIDAEGPATVGQAYPTRETEAPLDEPVSVGNSSAYSQTEPVDDSSVGSEEMEVFETPVVSETVREPKEEPPVQEVAPQAAAVVEDVESVVQEASPSLEKIENSGDVETRNEIDEKQTGQQEQPPSLQKDGSSQMTFEPYHTVDYFASQGIKISTEVFGNNKLDAGLKSFTAWLKTMKRLPAPEMQKASDTGSEGLVMEMANNSVTQSTVVTEAMAEVWAKQGARDKAADIYNKLSLSDPSKSAYFAAKIENLTSS